MVARDWEWVGEGGKWVWLKKGNAKNPRGSGDGCILTASLSLSWLGYCTVMLKDDTTRGIWAKGTSDFPGLGESTIISKLKSQKKKVKVPN